MCYFMYGIADKELSPKVIEEYHREGIFILDETSLVKDAKPSNSYYNISNGHCACDIVISPFDKVDEVKGIISRINAGGPFRFVIINSEYEDEYLQFDGNKYFEETLEALPEENITLEELLKIYPNYINHDTVYNVTA